MYNLWCSKLGQYLLWGKEEVETGRRDRGNYGAGNSLFLVQVYNHISMFTLVIHQGVDLVYIIDIIASKNTN